MGEVENGKCEGEGKCRSAEKGVVERWGCDEEG